MHESVDLSNLFYVFHISCPVDKCFVNQLGVVRERVLLPFGLNQRQAESYSQFYVLSCDLGKSLWILGIKYNLNGLVVDTIAFGFLASVCQGNLEPHVKSLLI